MKVVASYDYNTKGACGVCGVFNDNGGINWCRIAHCDMGEVCGFDNVNWESELKWILLRPSKVQIYHLNLIIPCLIFFTLLFFEIHVVYCHKTSYIGWIYLRMYHVSHAIHGWECTILWEALFKMLIVRHIPIRMLINNDVSAKINNPPMIWV